MLFLFCYFRNNLFYLFAWIVDNSLSLEAPEKRSTTDLSFMNKNVGIAFT